MTRHHRVSEISHKTCLRNIACADIIGCEDVRNGARQEPSLQMIYYLIASFILLALFWWVWHPLGAAVAILMTGYFRVPVVNRAAFWDSKTILTVGIIWGAAMALATRKIIGVATSSRLLAALLLFEGLMAVQYVGFQPRPEDEFMYNKAGQTATVGSVCYLLVTSVALAIGGWPH
jgi:hypothetical protein